MLYSLSFMCDLMHFFRCIKHLVGWNSYKTYFLSFPDTEEAVSKGSCFLKSKDSLMKMHYPGIYAYPFHHSGFRVVEPS